MPTSNAVSPMVMTPPQLARRWNVSADKILAFIRSGQLRAFNVATRLGGRPRWRISLGDVQAFEEARAAAPTPTRKRLLTGNYTRFDY
jgi:hypothetical protein